jgi:ribosomal protein S18 acetylase RimI-like enzyme
VEGLARLAAERDGGAQADHRAKFEQELRERAVSEDHHLLLVAALGASVAGFARATRFQPGPDAPANTAPPGWYLSGVIVDPAHRRRGIAAELTRRRLKWIAERAGEAFYFANARNQVSISSARTSCRGCRHPVPRRSHADLMTGEWTRWLLRT